MKFLAGTIAGALFCYLMFSPTETEKTTVKTETVYLTKTETVFLRVPSPIFLRDTVIVEGGKETRYPVNSYSGIEPALFGNISWTAETSGHLNKIDLKTDFRIPQVSHTVERTVVVKPSGVYASGSVANDFDWSVGAVYLKDRSLFGYDYHPRTRTHRIRTGWRVF